MSYNHPMMQPSQPTTEPTNVHDDKLTTIMIMSFVLTVLWIFVGLAAFVMSLICLGRTGTTAQHVIGILLSVFFGPFYWIYYFVASSYCRGPKKRKFMSR